MSVYRTIGPLVVASVFKDQFASVAAHLTTYIMTCIFQVCLLFQGLRMNRTLLSLSLANNHIGDKGAIKLAEVKI